MGFTLVQAPNPGFNAAGTSTSVTISVSVPSGSVIWALAWAHGTSTIPTVSDNVNAGNYTQSLTNTFFSTDPTSENHKINSASAAANGLTITATASGATSIGIIAEVRNPSGATVSFDVGTSQGSNGADPLDSTATAAVSGGDEIVYAPGVSGTPVVTYTAGTGYAIDSQGNDSTVGSMGQETKSANPMSGTQDATMTQGATNPFYMYAAVFKAASARIPKREQALYAVKRASYYPR